MNIEAEQVRPVAYFGPQALVPLYVSTPVALSSFVVELIAYGPAYAKHYWGRRRVTRAMAREIRQIRRAMRP